LWRTVSTDEASLGLVVLAVGQEDLELIDRRGDGLESNKISGTPAGGVRPLREADLPYASVLQDDIAPIVNYLADVEAVRENHAVTVPAAVSQLGRSLTLGGRVIRQEQNECDGEGGGEAKDLHGTTLQKVCRRSLPPFFEVREVRRNVRNGGTWGT
jgi:hypothetical protein